MSNQSNPDQERTSLEQAFTALKTFDRGANRGCLMPIDKCVRGAMADSKQCSKLEEGLLEVSREAGLSVIAREYICSKLAWIGSSASVALLTSWLPDPAVSLAARAALERIPSAIADEALRASVNRLPGVLKAGVIQTLGRRRNQLSVKTIAACLDDADPHVRNNALSALGQIGTPASARILAARYKKSAGKPSQILCDAILACAEQLLAARQQREAQSLLSLLTSASTASHVRKAAELRL